MKSLNRVVFQLTRKCNLICPHCFFNAGPKSKERLSLSQTSKALSDLNGLGFNEIKTFILTGGEPTLWPGLLSLIKNIRSRFPEAKIRIDTNGLNFFNNPELFGKIGADIYDISVDSFHNDAVLLEELKNKNIFVRSNGLSLLVDTFLKNREKNNFDLSVRWTSDRQDDVLFNRFCNKYHKKVKIEKKLVTATGRGKKLPPQAIDCGYLIADKPENFTCLMGDSLFLGIDSNWYGCYHPVGLTRLGRVGSEKISANFQELIKSSLYKKLPKDGLLKVLNSIKKSNPEKAEAIENVLQKKYWYRCQPCEDLCKLGIFKL